MFEGMALGGGLTVFLILGWKYISHKYPIAQTVKTDMEAAVQAIDKELERLHTEMSNFTGDMEGVYAKAYASVVAEVSALNSVLATLATKIKAEEKQVVTTLAQAGIAELEKLEK